MTSNHQASLLRPDQIARLPQFNARRKMQNEDPIGKGWEMRNSLPREEQESSQAHQTTARTSSALNLALKNQMAAARHMQMQRQQGAQSAQQPTQPQAGATGQRQVPQPQSSRIRFNQLTAETQRKVNDHIFVYPPSVMEEMRKAEDWLSEAKARFGQALQRLQVAETRKEEFQHQAQQRLAAGSALIPQIMDIFNTKIAQCDKAMTELQTVIENFTAQQNEFRHAPSQRHAQPCSNVAIADSQPFEFFKLPPEIRNMTYQQVLLAGKPLSFHASGLLVADEGNRPDTAIMATCKQMLEEARTVFYSINSFVIEERAVLSHHLKATPQPLQRLKLHAIRHAVLDGCDLLNITRIAELKRLRSLETLTVFEMRFHRQLPGWHDQYHGIIFDAGHHHADMLVLSRVKNLVDNLCYKPTLKTMMLMRPSVKYKVIYEGALEWNLRCPIGSRFLLTFTVSWDPEGGRYVFRCESIEENGRYL